MPKSYTFIDLIKIMGTLRGPGGCPWDREQTHDSLIKYLKEESGEVIQAIKGRDHRNLEEELGDLLLQIVFHAQIARESKTFTINNVVDTLCRKLKRRHPHVFGKKKLHTAEQVKVEWEKIKAREKKRKSRR